MRRNDRLQCRCRVDSSVRIASIDEAELGLHHFTLFGCAQGARIEPGGWD